MDGIKQSAAAINSLAAATAATSAQTTEIANKRKNELNQKEALVKEYAEKIRHSKPAVKVNIQSELLAIAAACNQYQVKRVIGRLGITLGQIGDNSSQSYLKQQISNVMQKGSIKLHHLQEEELKEADIKKARLKKALKKAELKRAELNNYRLNNKMREISDAASVSQIDIIVDDDSLTAADTSFSSEAPNSTIAEQTAFIVNISM